MVRVSRTTLGVDPDLHTTAVAALIDRVPVFLKIFRVSKNLKGDAAMIAMIDKLADPREWPRGPADLIAIESQQVYRGSEARGNQADLIRLAHVTGAALLSAGQLFPQASMAAPTPQAWKGQVPKHIHHQRVLKRLGIEYSMQGEKVIPKFSRATLFDPPPLGEMHHVLDALALAVWADENAKDYSFKRREP